MSGEIEDALNETQLEDLYSWVDTIPLSRPKKNIARDFSDGGNDKFKFVVFRSCFRSSAVDHKQKVYLAVYVIC